ncbi:MAG: hypothetical protein AAF694_11575 [Bacteroidota bacterium]
MQEKKELLKNVGGLALTTGLALLTQHAGQNNLFLGVLNGIAGNLASNFVEKVEYNKLRKLLRENDPSDLNHDLVKLIAQAVEWAVQNIEILYKKKLTDNSQVEALKQHTKKILKELGVLSAVLAEYSGSIYQEIEAAQSPEELLRRFDLQVADFPIIKDSEPYPSFFKDQFIPNLQLCFSELLKQERNRPAYIAYQREVYSNLNGSIQELILQNNRLLAQVKEKDARKAYQEENGALAQMLDHISQTNLAQIQPEFEQSFVSSLAHLEHKTDLLLGHTQWIQEDLQAVKGITKRFDQSLKENWIEKNKVWIGVLLVLAIAYIGFLLFRQANRPFTMNIQVGIPDSLQIDPGYPILSSEARIRFYLPQESKEKEITFDNELLFPALPSKIAGLRIRVELQDRNWELHPDSLDLKPGITQLYIRPNQRLSRVEGKVLSRDGKILLEGVRILVSGMETFTDINGTFSLDLPIEKRKKQHKIRLEKAEYEVVELEYIAGSPKEIRLSPLSHEN